MFDVNIFLPECSEKDKEKFRILKGYPQKSVNSGDFVFFSENFFNLSRSRLWHELNPDIQKKVLENLSQNIIQELLQIEISGMAYSSKMSLLARNLDERQMYCEFSSQEARHFENIRPYLRNKKNLFQLSSFSHFVSQIVEKSNFIEGLLLIQTALEGWGISYYRELMKSSLDSELQVIFKNILRDEIKHHSSGIHIMENPQSKSFFEQSPLSKVTLQEMLVSIAMGPVSVAKEIFNFVPGANEKLIEEFLIDIEAQKIAQSKMELMLNVLSQAIEPEGIQVFKIFTEIWSTNKMAKYVFDQLDISKSTPLWQGHSLS